MAVNSVTEAFASATMTVEKFTTEYVFLFVFFGVYWTTAKSTTHLGAYGMCFSV